MGGFAPAGVDEPEGDLPDSETCAGREVYFFLFRGVRVVRVGEEPLIEDAGRPFGVAGEFLAAMSCAVLVTR